MSGLLGRKKINMVTARKASSSTKEPRMAKAGPENERKKKSKAGPKQKKVSGRSTAKWQSIPSDLKSVAASMFEDATSRFEGSGEEEVEEALHVIKQSFLRRLTSLRLPDKKWTSEKDMNYLTDGLHAESDMLERMETDLNHALLSEERKVQELDEKAERLRMANYNQDTEDEVHPILQALQER